MNNSAFDVILSGQLDAKDIELALTELIPRGLKVDVFTTDDDLPDEVGAIWSYTSETSDPAWPCILKVIFLSDKCELGSYPDLRIAKYLSERFSIDVFLWTNTYPFMGNIDPQDPYWSLAYISQQWYLASTVQMSLLMGGTNEQSASINLVRPVIIPDIMK